ncbi:MULTISPECIES: LysR family transcriptional regulator [Streptomyces]|nr:MULTISPECIES: LysR family transcriptional regulator [Streptomyces]
MPNPHRKDLPPDLATVWLRVFLEVARHESFTVAARTLGWTQSAVSRQIAALEAALGGGPLFDRLPRGVRLTAAGRVLVPYAQTVTGALHGVARELAALREGAGGRLRFGAFPTADAALVPHALGAFRTRRPGVRVSPRGGADAVVAWTGSSEGRLGSRGGSPRPAGCPFVRRTN